MRRSRTLLLLMVACRGAGVVPVPDSGVDALCRPCTTADSCGSDTCTQYAGGDFCAATCVNVYDCPANTRCIGLVSTDGMAFKGCVPSSGTCGEAPGCAGCDAGACDLIAGSCAGATSSDAGGAPGRDGGIVGSVNPDGGAVSRLYFAVVGDTRPAVLDATGSYPTPLITRIYQEIQALDPRPQFVVATGDYIFADPWGSASTQQLALYKGAMAKFSGTVFGAMGNHECTSLSALNCASWDTRAFQEYRAALVTPLGKTKPYYTVPFTALDGSWTAKLVVLACNDWDSTQRTWFAGEMAKPTTYTFVARHQPSGGPCTDEADQIMATQPYDLLLVGHLHRFDHSGKSITVGISGAPILTGDPYGFVTIEQLGGDAGFRVVQYDESTAAPVTSFVVP